MLIMYITYFSSYSINFILDLLLNCNSNILISNYNLHLLLSNEKTYSLLYKDQ